MSVLSAIFSGMVAVFGFVPTDCQEAVKIGVSDWYGLDKEIPTIIMAAERNKCYGEDFLILLAIRKAENGRSGREFGVMHPRCLKQIEKEPHRSLDIQTGWAAATIVMNRGRWERASRPCDFILWLANRYCPAVADPQGHINWLENVNFWYRKFKENGVTIQAGTLLCKTMI